MLMKIERNCKIECQQCKIPAEWEVAALDQCIRVIVSTRPRAAVRRAQTPDPGRAFPRHFTCTQATCRPPVLECLSRDHATRVLDEAASPDPDPGPRGVLAISLTEARAAHFSLSPFTCAACLVGV